MKQYLLFLLITVVIFAQDNSHLDMRAKAKSDGTLVKAKLQLYNPMIDFEAAKNYKMEANFITHITAIVENEIVLDISTSPFFVNNPVIKYKFKDVNQANAIKYIITNNKGEKKEHFFEIKREYKLLLEKKQFKGSKTSVINFREKHPLVWEAKNSQEAIKDLYGSVENPIMNKINLIMPKRINCGWSIPVRITSDVDLKSLAIFISTDKAVSPLAIFSISPFSLIDYRFNIKIRGKQYSLITIGKDRNGNFYKVTNKGSLPYTDDGCL